MTPIHPLRRWRERNRFSAIELARLASPGQADRLAYLIELVEVGALDPRHGPLLVVWETIDRSRGGRRGAMRDDCTAWFLERVTGREGVPGG